jgi:hypothetical protein
MSRSCDHVVQAALPNAKQMKSSLLFIMNAAGKCGLSECAASGAEEAPNRLSSTLHFVRSGLLNRHRE